MQQNNQRPIGGLTLLLTAALLVLLMILNGCSAQPASDQDNEYGLGACLADCMGDHCGAAWIERYADTGDPGTDIIQGP